MARPDFAQIRIDISKLLTVSDRASDLSPAFAGGVQVEVTDFLTKKFDAEGAYMGEKWAGHSPSTIEDRKQPGRGRGGIGRDTNVMWSSFVKSAGLSPAPNGILFIDKTTYERGSTLSRSSWFSFGTRRQPARPIFPDPLPKDLVDRITGVIDRYVRTGNVS